MFIIVCVCSEIFMYLWKMKVYLKNWRFINKKRNCDENEVLGLFIERFSGFWVYLMSDVIGWCYIFCCDVICVVFIYNKFIISGLFCRLFVVLLVFRYCYLGELCYMVLFMFIDGNVVVFWINNMYILWCRIFVWIEIVIFCFFNFCEVMSWWLNFFIGLLNVIGFNNVGFCKLVCGLKYLIDLYFFLV